MAYINMPSKKNNDRISNPNRSIIDFIDIGSVRAIISCLNSGFRDLHRRIDRSTQMMREKDSSYHHFIRGKGQE